MFCWGSTGRMRPSRMLWLAHNYNEPMYELAKWRRRGLCAMPRLGMFLDRESKVEQDREMRQRFPGEIGKWPFNKKKRPRSAKFAHHGAKLRWR